MITHRTNRCNRSFILGQLSPPLPFCGIKRWQQYGTDTSHLTSHLNAQKVQMTLISNESSNEHTQTHLILQGTSFFCTSGNRWISLVKVSGSNSSISGSLHDALHAGNKIQSIYHHNFMMYNIVSVHPGWSPKNVLKYRQEKIQTYIPHKTKEKILNNQKTERRARGRNLKRIGGHPVHASRAIRFCYSQGSSESN